ncbi:hypothetical protein ABIF16_008886 [Bradyrhizobium elkanii]
MVSLIKPGARLLRVDGPVIETARLILRPWRASDVAENRAAHPAAVARIRCR